MLSEKLCSALCNQINAEYYSAYLYLTMSSAASELGLKGTSNWLFVQAQEEMAHGTHIWEYILERGAVPVYAAIAQPSMQFNEINEIFNAVLEHERKITKSINDIATIAMEERDHASYQFLMWYVDEQVEEESNANDILDKLSFIADNKGLLLTLDNELGARIYVNPFPKNG